jgi:hypothetical protein
MENQDMEDARQVGSGNYGKILTTPEAIVREHRKHWETVHHVGFKESERPEPIGALAKTKNRRGSVLELVCWILVIAALVYLSIFVFGPFLSQVFGKEIDISVSTSAIYDEGRWAGGPDGAHRKTDIAPAFEGQIKYTGWKYQPTLAFSYRQENFDFKAPGAPIQEANPRAYGIHLGATRQFKYFDVYALAGITYFEYRLKLTENFSGKMVTHYGRPDSNLFNLKIGIYKLWDLGGVKIGPEISAEIYPDRPSFDRCRSFRMNPIVPHMGLRAQW